MSSKQVQSIEDAIKDQEGIVLALENDLANVERFNAIIESKQELIVKTQNEIVKMQADRLRMPESIAAAKQRLAMLKQQRTATSSSRDVNKLQALLAKAIEQGVDVQALLAGIQGND